MLVGNIDPSQAVAYAQEKFASFSGKRNEEPEATDPFFNNFATSNRIVYDTQNKYEYTYYWQGPSRQTSDEAAIEYILTALGKRLEQSWVDDKGWCLSANAGQYNLRHQGAALVQLEPKPEHKDIPFDRLLSEQIEDIIKNSITDDEYAQIHRQELRHLILLNEQPQLFSSRLSFQFFPHKDGQGWYERSPQGYVDHLQEYPSQLYQLSQRQHRQLWCKYHHQHEQTMQSNLHQDQSR